MTYHIHHPSNTIDNATDDASFDASFDANLDALLDEALAPAEPSPQLDERIIAATHKQLARDARPWHRRTLRLGAVASLSAAAVIGAAVVGQWLAVVVHRSDVELLALQADIDAMVEVERIEAPIDQQIDRLAIHIDHAQDTDPWDASLDELDAALSEWQDTWNNNNSSF